MPKTGSPALKVFSNPPIAINLHLRLPLIIVLGLDLLTVLLVPNCPLKFRPHEYKVFWLSMAKIDPLPAAIFLQAVPPAIVVCGLERERVELVPSCPLELAPHVHKVPSDLVALLCSAPP